MDEPRVTIAIDDGVADVRLNRPEKLNVIDPAMFDALADAIAMLSTSAGLRAVVLSGAGRGFCAGLDLAGMAAGGPAIDLTATPHGVANRVQQAAWGWRSLAVPVIAAVHGVAFGGGLQIMAGADVRFVAAGTRLSVTELQWGIVPDMGGWALWRGCVRDDVLRRLTYTAAEFDADAAVRDGFATAVVDDPHGAAIALARTIASRNPDAIRAAKRLANLSADADPATMLAAERIEQVALIGTPNQREAVRAAMERRSPDFV